MGGNARSVCLNSGLTSTASRPHTRMCMANIRTFATEAKRDEREGAGIPHFRASPVHHPLHVDKHVKHVRTPHDSADPDPVQLHVKLKSDDFFLPMVNTIWSKEQLEERCRQDGQPVHIPQTRWDKMVHWSVKKFLYRGFNWISGYNYENPSPRACEYRLIVLESVAGVAEARSRMDPHTPRGGAERAYAPLGLHENVRRWDSHSSGCHSESVHHGWSSLPRLRGPAAGGAPLRRLPGGDRRRHIYKSY